MTTIARRSTITRVTAVSITLVLGAGIIGACSSDDDKTTTFAQGTSTTAQGSSPANQLVNVKDVKPVSLPLALNEGVPAGTKIGLLVSGTGPGNDLFGEATGAYIAAFRLNGAKGSGSDTVKLIVKDDGSGDPAAATAAMQDLISQGVAGVVYASTGDQMVPAVQAAAQAGVPVLVPYSGDTRLLASGTTTYLTGPTDDQVAAKLVKMAAARNLSKVGVLHQTGSYGDAGLAAVNAAGVTPVKDAAFATSDPDVKKQVDELGAAGMDSLIVWADGPETAKVTNAVANLATPVPIFFASRAATPAFGRLQNTLLAPTASDGMISAGTWAGAWTPTQQVDTFFAAKPLAVSDGGVITDLGFADIRSHDAVVAIAFAAKAANSNSASSVLTALKGLKLDAASTPLDFSKQAALTDGNVAALSYSTVDDGSGRYPEFATAGGHWVAVDGSYTFPDSLKGLDNAYGG